MHTSLILSHASLRSYSPQQSVNNLVRIVKGAVPAGYAPGFIFNEFGELDNSKPPVAALALRAVFAAFGEPWLVALLLDSLVRFNAWWVSARMVQGIVVPGSQLDPALAPVERAQFGSLQAAKWVAGRAPGLYSMRDVLGV